MTTQDFSEQQQIRREKRQRLIDEGRDAYPVEVDRTTSLKDLRAKYDGTLEPGDETQDVVAVAGRIMFQRNTGKLFNQAPIEATARFDPFTDWEDFEVNLRVTGVPLKQLNDLSRAYGKFDFAGGTGDLTRHFTVRGERMRLSSRLMSHISFVRHNLATDAVFCEAAVILCCNVLIYFERPLQCRALELFSDSLVRGGYLCLGQRETPIGADGRFASMTGSRWVYRPTAQPRPPLALPSPLPDERIK